MKFLHITDYDDTISPRLVDKENHALHIKSYREFIENNKEFIPVISSGRVVSNIINIVEENKLPLPRYIIGSVGVEIYDCKKKKHITEWRDFIKKNAKFNNNKVVELLEEYQLQPPHQQIEYKVCYEIPNMSEEQLLEIKKKLLKHGIEANTVYSSKQFLDVIPAITNKGIAGEFLAKYLNIPLQNVAISGDSGNDIDMFLKDFGIKIAPRNADEELLDKVRDVKNFYHASQDVAFGTVEGLEFFLKQALKI